SSYAIPYITSKSVDPLISVVIFPRLSAFMVFFFQAEDGIRDFHVTGVQTCALPISKLVIALVRSPPNINTSIPLTRGDRHLLGRSEERRVGKECRYRWSRYH